MEKMKKNLLLWQKYKHWKYYKSIDRGATVTKLDIEKNDVIRSLVNLDDKLYLGG